MSSLLADTAAFCIEELRNCRLTWIGNPARNYWLLLDLCRFFVQSRPENDGLGDSGVERVEILLRKMPDVHGELDFDNASR